jgi:ADP-ribose pyrophosphatase YjhB (NUDIX family)
MNVYHYYCKKDCCHIQIKKFDKKQNQYKPRTNYKKAGVFIFDPKENRVLLVQSRGHLFGFPKGTLEIGESEIKGAIREVKEETGIDVSKYRFTKATRIKDRAICFYLEMDTCKVSLQTKIKDNDANGITWIKISCLEECISNGNIYLNHYSKIIFERFLKKTFTSSGFSKVTYKKGKLYPISLH